MRASVMLVLVLVACGDKSTEPVPPPKPVDAGAPLGPVTRAPHTGAITVLAVTDRGEAAVSIDDTGGMRLWPSLDGVHEPVVVRGRAGVELAIARADGDVLVAVLDAAGGLERMRFTADGALRGRELLPADPGFVELAAGGTAMLARRADHAIVRLDVPALLEPEPGQHILGLAARRGTAFAAIADRERPEEIAALREITFANGLSWGATVTLPVPLSAPFAISPSGKRIAAQSSRTRVGVVIELAAEPRVIGTDALGPVDEDRDDHVLGFLDDGRVVFRGGVVVEVPQITAAVDPWATATSSNVRTRFGTASVVTDGKLVAGHAMHLMLAAPGRTQFLGYRHAGYGELRVVGEQVTLVLGHRLLWLDDKLAVKRTHEVHDAAEVFAIDDHRVLRSSYWSDYGHSRLDIMLRDAKTGRDVALGRWPQGSNLAYDPGTGVFAVSGYSTTISRAKLDAATGKLVKLRSLKTRAQAVVEVLDPALASGAVAAAYTYNDLHTSMRVETFVEDNRSGALAPSSSVTLGAQKPIGFDRAGTYYGIEAPWLYGYRDGKLVVKLPVPDANAGAVDRGGTRFAVASTTHVVMLDMTGKELWRVPAWQVNVLRFTADTTVLVNTHGGLLALDAATGARRAAGCGWSFGLTDEELPLWRFSAPVVCGDDV